jgi:RNA polymerase sigma-70 factor (ECF subfamily)
VFRYSFAEVADVVGRTPAACRQLASSARRRLRGAVTPSAPSASQAVIVRDFKLAWESGDIEGLIDLLAPDAVVTSDGGGRVNTVLRPIEGADRIAGAVVRLEQTLRDLTLEEHTVNGRPGLIARRNGVTVSVYAFQVTEERITHIWAVRNPEKLRPWISADSPA